MSRFLLFNRTMHTHWVLRKSSKRGIEREREREYDLNHETFSQKGACCARIHARTWRSSSGLNCKRVEMIGIRVCHQIKKGEKKKGNCSTTLKERQNKTENYMKFERCRNQILRHFHPKLSLEQHSLIQENEAVDEDNHNKNSDIHQTKNTTESYLLKFRTVRFKKLYKSILHVFNVVCFSLHTSFQLANLLLQQSFLLQMKLM